MSIFADQHHQYFQEKRVSDEDEDLQAKSLNVNVVVRRSAGTFEISPGIC